MEARLEVSEIGFGAWAIGGSWGDQKEADSLEALETALDQGVKFIDTAAGYGNGKSERIIGEVPEIQVRISICLYQDTSRSREMASFSLVQDR